MPSYKLPPEFTVTIERLVFEGEGLAHFAPTPDKKARPVFVAGVLPGETVRVRPMKVRGKFSKAKLIEVIKAAPLRREPREPSYLSTSPWQVMPESEQLRLKRETVLSMWRHTAGELPLPDVDIVASPDSWGYRNKLEYAVVETPLLTKEGLGEVEDGIRVPTSTPPSLPLPRGGAPLCLAFRERGQYWARVACPEGTALAPDAMNAVARQIVEELNRQRIPAEAVKNLLVRYSFLTGQTFAALFVTTREVQPFALQPEGVSGFLLAYSDPKRSQSVITEILHEQGTRELVESIGGIELTYGHESFFQVNPPAFDLLMAELRRHVTPRGVLADLYAGVGSIGFALAASGGYDRLLTIEQNPEAVSFARRNAEQLPIPVEIIGGATESQSLVELLAGADTVIVDPPRAGLHEKAVRQLLEAAPQTLVYVSCNPATQARDWALLREKYDVAHWQLFDLYPQTPHVESLLVLTRR